MYHVVKHVYTKILQNKRTAAKQLFLKEKLRSFDLNK